MVAMLAFGGTFAYFTAKTEGKSGTFHTGTIALTTAAESVTLTGHTKALLPSEKVTAEITYSDGSDRGTYVFFKVDTSALTTDKFELTAVKLNGVALEKCTTEAYKDVYYYLNSQADTDAAKGDKVIATELKVTFEVTYKATVGNEDMGKDYSLSVQACSIQHEGFNTQEEAVAQSGFKAQ